MNNEQIELKKQREQFKVICNYKEKNVQDGDVNIGI